MIGKFIGAPIGAPLGGATAAQALVQTSTWQNISGGYTHALTVGGVTLSPNLYTNANGVSFDHVLQAGANSLVAFLWQNENVGYVHVLTPGPVNLAPSTFENQSFGYQHAIEFGAAQTISPDLFENAPTYYEHLADVAGIKNLAPELYENTSSSFVHVITSSNEIAPSSFENEEIIYAHEVGQYMPLDPELWQNENVGYIHAITTGEVILLPSLFVNDPIYREHIIGNRRRRRAPRGETATYGEQDSTVRPVITTSRPSESLTRRP